MSVLDLEWARPGVEGCNVSRLPSWRSRVIRGRYITSGLTLKEEVHPPAEPITNILRFIAVI